MKKILLFLTALFMGYEPGRAGDTTLYVSPGGGGDGSEQSPASLSKAVAALSQLKKVEKGTITVILKEGVYELDAPLLITPENSGTRDLKILFKAASGARPVISGGRKTGLQGNGILSADIAGLLRGAGPEDLYVGDQRATRNRTPDTGFLRLGKTTQTPIGTAGEGETRFLQYFEIPGELYKELSLLSPDRLKAVRLNIYHKWTTTIRTIDSLSTTTPGVYSTGAAWASYNPITEGSLFFIENGSTILTKESEWLFTEDKKIKYKPCKAGPKKLEAVVPVIEKLLLIKGNSRQKAANVYFDGITFSYTNKPFSGIDDAQAAASVDAAIMLEDAENIHFAHCRMRHLGQYAVWFGKGTRYCSIRESYLNDLGAGGIRIGETRLPEDPRDLTAHITVKNCIVQSGGYNYPPAVGIFIAHAADNRIIHNDIADFRYTGISVGWVWGYAYSPSVNNKILYNHIHHLGWGILSDMGGVYTLGVSPGTEVSHNVIHDIYAYDYGGWGLYTDEGSTGIRMENNLVYHTKTGSFHQHYGKDNRVNNNILAFSRQYLAQDSRIEDHLSFEFKHNILWSGGEPFFQGCWKTGRVDIDSNCYWSASPADSLFMISTMDYGGRPIAGLSFGQWQRESGKDGHSLFTDPGFREPAKFDFRFRDPAVTARIGFIPFDYGQAGVTGSEEWKKLARLPDHIIQAFDRSVNENGIK